jgi:selenocysteine-specific elongation factor
VSRREAAPRRRREKPALPPVGREKERLAAVCRWRGIRGARSRDLVELGYLSEDRLARLGEELEAEGKVKILSFSPLFLISRESFEYLCDKIVRYLEEFHRRHPSLKGVPEDKLKARFGVSQVVLRLALKTLDKAGQVRAVRDRLMLASHAETLSPQEEKILQRLEELYYRGAFQSVPLDEIRRQFRLSEGRLDALVSILVERKKIIEGPEGLYIHSHWLDQTIEKVRALGKKEMTVGEFKALTGLSRKYAIPLLELLDQLGVTRRKGAVRDIL